jgi:hypothetical protein
MKYFIATILLLQIQISYSPASKNNLFNSNENRESIMDNKDEINEEISGKYIENLFIAYTEFKKSQKNINDFTIQIQDNNEEIKITFNPNLAKGERILGGKTSLGRSVTYTLSKDKNEIIKSNYHR